jgi:hypothetical protein
VNRRAPAAFVAGVVAFACIIHAYGCKNDGTHVYQARFYLEGRDCLGTSSAIDVVEGEEPGNCEAICFRQVRGDAGNAIYVSSMCPPYPADPDFERSGRDPACPAALAAFARNDTCLSDGGSTRPIVEAGAD